MLKDINYNELETLETFLTGSRNNSLAKKTARNVIESLRRMRGTSGQLLSLLAYHQSIVNINNQNSGMLIENSSQYSTYLGQHTKTIVNSTENQKIQALFDSFLMIAAGTIQQVSPLIESAYFKKSDVNLQSNYNLSYTVTKLRKENDSIATSLVTTYDEKSRKPLWKDLKYLRDGVAHKYTYEIIGGYNSENGYNAFISFRKKQIPVVILCKNISVMLDEFIDAIASKLKLIK